MDARAEQVRRAHDAAVRDLARVHELRQAAQDRATRIGQLAYTAGSRKLNAGEVGELVAFGVVLDDGPVPEPIAAPSPAGGAKRPPTGAAAAAAAAKQQREAEKEAGNHPEGEEMPV